MHMLWCSESVALSRKHPSYKTACARWLDGRPFFRQATSSDRPCRVSGWIVSAVTIVCCCWRTPGFLQLGIASRILNSLNISNLAPRHEPAASAELALLGFIHPDHQIRIPPVRNIGLHSPDRLIPLLGRCIIESHSKCCRSANLS